MRNKLAIILITISLFLFSIACTDDIVIVDGGISTERDQTILDAQANTTPMMGLTMTPCP